MKDFIEAKLQEGRFSTPSEYIRSLIRGDQEQNQATSHSDRVSVPSESTGAAVRRSQIKRARNAR